MQPPLLQGPPPSWTSLKAMHRHGQRAHDVHEAAGLGLLLLHLGLLEPETDLPGLEPAEPLGPAGRQERLTEPQERLAEPQEPLPPEREY